MAVGARVRALATRGRMARLASIAAVLLLVRYGNAWMIALESDAPSESTGSPARGALAHGRRLPSRGENFVAYSDLGALLGRNSVHRRVRDCVMGAYERLAREMPDRRFVYGETSWPHGGRLWPHHTHQNGLSVDFFVPVRDGDDAPATLDTSVFDGFGYRHDFDARGAEGNLRIDFEAIAAHLRALRDAAPGAGVRIERVIFDGALQERLFASPGAGSLRGEFPWQSRAWVRHDEHYHVDFALR